MQWTGDRNAGFSRADPARLYAPVIMDPVYGYQAVNVEAQERGPHPLLNWMKHIIALRRRHRVFSRGSLEFLLDLSMFKGRTPVEMLGLTPFPPIGDLPYFLTLAPYGFYWFLLRP
jgi:maltose alpha-D-glucosyltransferase / alpha-amylase